MLEVGLNKNHSTPWELLNIYFKMLSLHHLASTVLIAVIVAAVASNTLPGDHGPRSTCYKWVNRDKPLSLSSEPPTVHVGLLKPNQNLRLARRLTPETRTVSLHPGLGACGKNYDDSSITACLWSGSANTTYDGHTPGWLTGASTANCFKELYIYGPSFAEGKQPLTAIVRDACPMDAEKPVDLEHGCLGIYLSKKLYDALTDANGVTKVTSWDFDKKNPAW